MNALIHAFREGDEKAELELYLRYIRRIKMLMRKSPWYSEIKDKESLAIDIWLSLREWFKDNIIEKGEGVVLVNRVRGMVRDQAVKDQREVASGSFSNPGSEGDGQDEYQDEHVRKYIEAIEKEAFESCEPKVITDTYMNVRISFRKLIAICLWKLKDRQRVSLDRHLNKGHTMTEIGKDFNLSHVTISQEIKAAIAKLRNCLSRTAFQHLERSYELRRIQKTYC